jgi:hypothetical protein
MIQTTILININKKGGVYKTKNKTKQKKVFTPQKQNKKLKSPNQIG